MIDRGMRVRFTDEYLNARPDDVAPEFVAQLRQFRGTVVDRVPDYLSAPDWAMWIVNMDTPADAPPVPCFERFLEPVLS